MISFNKLKESINNGVHTTAKRLNNKRKNIQNKIAAKTNLATQHSLSKDSEETKGISNDLIAASANDNKQESNDDGFINPRESKVNYSYIEFNKNLESKGITSYEEPIGSTAYPRSEESTSLIGAKDIELLKEYEERSERELNEEILMIEGKKRIGIFDRFKIYREGIYDKIIDYLTNKQKDKAKSKIEKIIMINVRKILRDVLHRLFMCLLQVLIVLQLGKLIPKSAELMLLKRYKKNL